MIQNYKKYIDADNLPKWIYSQALQNKMAFDIKGKVTPNSILDILNKILIYDGNVKINVRSDKSYQNGIDWM